MHPSRDQAREGARLGWTRAYARRSRDAELVRASVDAGFRSYWRAVGACRHAHRDGLAAGQGRRAALAAHARRC